MTAGMDRDEIVRRFEGLLDSALASEMPPSGIEAEILSSVMAGSDDTDERCDSFALWAAMTALTQETKLQGRAFQELNRSFLTHLEEMAEERRRSDAERERTLQRETERRCRKEMLGTLIDLRDRLGRGRESVRASEIETGVGRKRWWARIVEKRAVDPAADAIAALIRGYELGIERLDDALTELNAREIQCQGESFDPRRMNAIESEESATVPSNTVLEVYRSGYEWNGEVFRTAQVKVSREPAMKK